MLTRLPPARVLHEWDAICTDLRKVIHLDAKRSLSDVLGQAIAGQLQFWRVTEPSEAYVATQVTRDSSTNRRTFWIIYAGGLGGGIRRMRGSMDHLMWQARKERCASVQFQGRDWRKVFPDFNASFSDGVWHYRKAT